MTQSTGKEVSSRRSFGADVTRIRNAYIEEIVAREDAPSVVKTLVPKYGWIPFRENKSDRVFESKSRRIGGKILEADQLSIQWIRDPLVYKPEHDEPDYLNDGANVIDLLLFRDQSPYVTELDLERNYDNKYSALVVPDTPPMLFNQEYYYDELLVPFTTTNRGDSEVSRVLKAMRLLGEDVIHYLSDSECSTIVSALQAVAPDIDTALLAEEYKGVIK